MNKISENSNYDSMLTNYKKFLDEIGISDKVDTLLLCLCVYIIIRRID